MSSHIERHAYAHQAHEDSLAADDAAREEAVEQAMPELKVEFLAALMGAREIVATPFFLRDGLPTMRYESIDTALADTLLDADTMATLMLALRESECPHIAKFRVAAARHHAMSYSDALADINLAGVEK